MTLAPGAMEAISAVKTGTPGMLSSMMAVTMLLQSQAESTIALALGTRNSLTWSFCLAGSNSPEVMRTSEPRRWRSTRRVSPISLKKGLVSVRKETAMRGLGLSVEADLDLSRSQLVTKSREKQISSFAIVRIGV